MAALHAGDVDLSAPVKSSQQPEWAKREKAASGLETADAVLLCGELRRAALRTARRSFRLYAEFFGPRQCSIMLG
jgi:hypothetical protein